MSLHILDPLLDRRWDDLAASHPRSSIFHSRAWLQALARTYGYRPMVATGTPAGRPLSGGIIFCEVDSWITGNRLVSLPFSDHAEPLLNETTGVIEIAEWMRSARGQNRWRYIELRPVLWDAPRDFPARPSRSFWLHDLSLEPPLGKIFDKLHRNCLQRRIRRAEHAQLCYENGRSESILNDFYQLLLMTRKRHCLLPQPRAWFRNLADCMGSGLNIRLVRKDGVPIAAILTMLHRGTAVYKYGCSDAKFHHLAGMPLLLWKLIEESKAAGAEQVDFGRTDLNNEGLIEFKDRFGTIRRKITYLRFPEHSAGKCLSGSNLPVVRRIFSVMPGAISSLAGKLAYRHAG